MQVLKNTAVFFLIGLALVTPKGVEAARPIPDVIIKNLVEFPVSSNEDLAHPDGVAIGPADGKLYVGFFGNVFLPETASYFKGIGRISGDGSVELVAEFPSPGGIVEEMVFDPNGRDLYVAVTRYNDPDGELVNGIVKVDVVNKTFTQFYGPPDLTDANGLDRDCAGNFYLTEPNVGKIHKIDPNGNGTLWLQNELLEGTGLVSPSGQINGVQGIAIDSKRQVLYGGNFDKSTIVQVPINNDGTAGEPSVLIEDPLLISIDTIGLSPDKRTLYASMLTTSTVVQINLRGRCPDIHVLVGPGDGVNVPIKTIPAVGFEDSSVENGLFVTDVGLLDGTAGRVSILLPDCPGHSRCTFYQGPMRLGEGVDNNCPLP